MAEKKFFGYSQKEVLENFNDAEDQVDSNKKIKPDESTLSQLVGASARMLKENADFLQTIYNDLDD